MTRSEIISFEHQRRELVQKLIAGTASLEDRNALHVLDNKIGGIDVVGVLFDEIKAQSDLLAKLGNALRAGIANQEALIAECRYHREEKGGYSDAFRIVHDETTLKLLQEQREALTQLQEFRKSQDGGK